MRGILVLAHGSREKAAENTLEQVMGYLTEMFREEVIETAYMEFSKINIHVGLERLREKGVDHVVIIPYFLYSGIHIKENVPQEIAAYLKDHQDMKVTLGKTLGADRRLADILADRIREAF